MSLNADIQAHSGNFALTAKVSLDAQARVGVIGRNGSGKTTLLRALAGLIPTSGSLAFDGVDWIAGKHFLPPRDRQLGMVFQNSALFPSMDVLANVAFGPQSRGASKAEAEAQARTWLERVDGQDLAARSVSELSGGEAKRIAFARAFATEPKLLLMDEPLAGVDSHWRIDFMILLQELLADFQGVALLVSHDAALIRSFSKEILCADQGRFSAPFELRDEVAAPSSEFSAHFFDRVRFQDRWLDADMLVASRASFEGAEEHLLRFVEDFQGGKQIGHFESGLRAELDNNSRETPVGQKMFVGLNGPSTHASR